MRILFAVAALGICIAAHAQEPLRTQGQVPGRAVPSQGQVPVPPAARQPQRIVLVDRIVAVVGREVVTSSELAERRVIVPVR